MNKLIFFITTLITFSTSGVYSQLDPHHEHDKEHHDDHQKHHNHLALFVGATTNFDHETTGFSIGVDYEYRLKAMHNLLGIGFIGEYVSSGSGEIIAGIPLFIHAAEKLKFMVAPIIVSAEDLHTHENETSFGVRLGAGSNFHVGKISMGPVINLDLGKTTALVYGVAIGFGF